jgi:glycosyltransferase involved in cell wall biosynthesis
VIVQADKDSELNWLVQNARSGRVVPPGDPLSFSDAVLRAYNERKELEEEGARARKHVVERYSKEAVGQRYSELIHKLTGYKDLTGRV